MKDKHFKNYKPCCKSCNKSFNMNSFLIREALILRDLDFSSIGAHCSDCYEEADKAIKEKRFVETYNGENIYQKDGMYAPYWGCGYAFDNLEDCKKRMDMKGVAITPFGMIKV